MSLDLNTIVGNGLIATSFKKSAIKSTDFLIFASGISNSNTVSEYDANREALLIKEHIKKANDRNKLFVYFSTCSIHEKELRPYSIHKLNMERIITSYSSAYLILRLPILVGKNGSKYQLINHLYDNLINEKEFVVFKNVQRQLIDVEDIPKIIYSLGEVHKLKNQIIDAGYNNPILVSDIVQILEEITSIKAIYTLKINESFQYSYDSSLFIEKLNDCGLVNALRIDPIEILTQNYSTFNLNK